jgi:NAD(P)-dependent dehydrogenase (short-subunit alcohol dehydrogenase family)
MTTNQSMAGKICMVTGATSGLGKATAEGLAALGAKVILVARDQRKAEEVKREIAQRTGNDSSELLLADLSSSASIRSAAADFLSRHPKLHVLVNQAGVIVSERQLTKEGVEVMFAVNHLAYFTLANLLLPALKAGAPSRIINIGGGVAAAGDIHFDDINGEKKFSWLRQAAQSKLGNVLFTYEMARRLQGTGVTVNCIDPGGARTGLAQNAKGLPRLMMKLMGPLMPTAEKGAQPAIKMASAPEFEGVTGKYFSKLKETKSAPKSYDEALAKRLWDVSAKLAGIQA